MLKRSVFVFRTLTLKLVYVENIALDKYSIGGKMEFGWGDGFQNNISRDLASGNLCYFLFFF